VATIYLQLMKMKAVGSYKMRIRIYQVIRRHVS